jgi:hypothetical protein
MKDRRTYQNIIFFSLVTCAIYCNKTFDEPPPYTVPDIRSTISIRQLRSMHFTGGFEKISDEHIVEGIVVANDSSDNFYKSIVIQDSTAGITMRMDGTGLYHLYPVGRKLFIKLKGLWLGDYAGMMQLGIGVDRADPAYPDLVALPQPLFDRHVIKGNQHNIITPVACTIERLNDSLQSCLVLLQGVEMPPSDTGRTYADAQNRVSLNRTIQSCTGSRAYIRTSGFAGFASHKTPRGNGNITAVYSIFRNDKQLVIRDTSDVQLHGLRCTGNGAKLLLEEDFETSTGTGQSGKGWKNIAETGGRQFQFKTSAGNQFAEISAFATGQTSVVSWLVSPSVNLTGSSDELLSFATRDGFDNGAILQALVSTNYDGGNTPWKAKWVPLKAVISKGSVNGLSAGWILSGSVRLDHLSGTIHIAFRYEGNDPVTPFDQRTTTFQLDNIRVMGN